MAVLYVIIIIHELGHLLVGKHLGFPIRTFSIGIGPLVSTLGTHHGIRYEVRLLPIAGYVSMADDADDTTLAPYDDTQHTPQQEIVLYAAGVLMNLLSVGLVQSLYLLLPWGIMSLTGQPYRGWLVSEFSTSVVQVFCDVSIWLVCFNLLPIPGLDGGRMLVAGIEVWCKRRFDADNKQLVHLAGMLLVLIWVAWDWIKFIGWIVAPLFE